MTDGRLLRLFLGCTLFLLIDAQVEAWIDGRSVHWGAVILGSLIISGVATVAGFLAWAWTTNHTDPGGRQ
jgi:hypothetical protein